MKKCDTIATAAGSGRDARSNPALCCDRVMLVHAHGFSVTGETAQHVRVELDARSGLPGFAVIGLGGGAARDARERVQTAVLNCGFGFPRRRLTANLTPAAAARSAAAFDLVLACCVLAVAEELAPERLARIGLFAQLGLGGDLRCCPGPGPAAAAAAVAGLSGLIVAPGDLEAARAGSPLPVLALYSLAQVAQRLGRVPAHSQATRRPPARA